MKAKSFVNLLPSRDNQEFSDVRNSSKRNFSIYKIPDAQQNSNHESKFYSNHWRCSFLIVKQLVLDLINSLDENVEKFEILSIINSTLNLTDSFAIKLSHWLNPQTYSILQSSQHESQPANNPNDPITGCIKHNFIKKTQMAGKLSQLAISSLQKQVFEINHALNKKKMIPFLKKLSDKKNQIFIPLEQNLEGQTKKSCLDFEQFFRERFLKEIQNRKFLEKIETASTQVQNVKTKSKKKNYENNENKDCSSTIEEINFDYDGSKIYLINRPRTRPNLKILKASYKLQKDKPEQKLIKLEKKFHEKISFKSRGSRTYLQMDSKTLTDFEGKNFISVIKQKVEDYLGKTDIKFVEKVERQYLGKNKQINKDQLTL